MPFLGAPMFGNLWTIAIRGSDNEPGEMDKSTDDRKWVVDALWILNSSNEIQGMFRLLALSSN